MTQERAKLNAEIASALGWRVWQDPRDYENGRWFMERDSQNIAGHIEVREVPDYISILRDDVKMHTGDH